VIEASGGINLGNIEEIAQTGINIISVGALTHSPRAVDISLEVMI
jgi:nicotinate-nucleotide pyrophosphorylase (carboxylating)